MDRLFAIWTDQKAYEQKAIWGDILGLAKNNRLFWLAVYYDCHFSPGNCQYSSELSGYPTI